MINNNVIKLIYVARAWTLPWRSVRRLSLTQLGHQWSEQLLLLVQSRPQRVRHVSWGGFHVLRCSDGFVQWAVQEILPPSRRCKLSRLFVTSDSCYCVVVARRWTWWWWAQPEVGVNTKKCDISSSWARKYCLDGLMEMTYRTGSGHKYWRGEGGAADADAQHFPASAGWWCVFVLLCVNLGQPVNDRHLRWLYWSGSCGAEQDLGVMDHFGCVEAKIMKFVFFKKKTTRKLVILMIGIKYNGNWNQIRQF